MRFELYKTLLHTVTVAMRNPKNRFPIFLIQAGQYMYPFLPANFGSTDHSRNERILTKVLQSLS
jgi:hypothetical protein